MSRWASIEKIKYSIWRSLDIISVKCVNSVFYLHIVLLLFNLQYLSKKLMRLKAADARSDSVKTIKRNPRENPRQKGSVKSKQFDWRNITLLWIQNNEWISEIVIESKGFEFVSVKRFPLILFDVWWLIWFLEKNEKTKPGKEELPHLVFVGY